MKNKLILFILLIPNFAFSQSAEELFLSGNEYYKEKKWNKAVEAYEGAIETGMESAALYYNLGNAHYKLKNFAAAILNYERAHLLQPGDEDIKFNLKLANEKTADKAPPENQTFPYRIWQRFLFLFDVNGWSILTIVLMWLAFGAGAIFLFTRHPGTKRISFFGSIILLAVVALSLFMTYESLGYTQNRDYAIVFVPNSYVKSEPDASGTDLFILHEGARVKVGKESNGWKKIQFGQNKIGWIRVEDIQII